MEKIVVVDDPEIISRPVMITETVYRLPPINCPTPIIDGSVGGYEMPEFIAWGQDAWNWISNCYNSIKDAEVAVGKSNDQK